MYFNKTCIYNFKILKLILNFFLFDLKIYINELE